MNFINKINQHLLERFPSIWNTKIVWVLLISACIHVLFFIFGLVSHINPESLQQYNVLRDYFENGLLLVNIIVSILLIVGWLIFMFKNNAFKSFYPTSNFQLFGQFVQYFIIIFVSTTFYYSYMVGFQAFVSSKYDDALMEKNIALTNSVYPFLPFDSDNYTITNKRYPEIFAELYCETDSSEIDFSKPFYTYYDLYYQFNNLYEVAVTERDEYERFVYPKTEEENGTPLAYSKEKDSVCYFYFKKDVADVSEYLKNANLNFGNFSDVFYVQGTGNYYGNYSTYDYNYYEDVDLSLNIQQNKKTVELIERNNPEEFKKLFSDFLAMSASFKIQNNLTVNDWMEIAYNPPTFDVKKFINRSYYYTDYYEDSAITSEFSYKSAPGDVIVEAEGNSLENIQTALRRRFERENTTKLYYDSSNLNYVFENIDNVKNTKFIAKSIHIFLWLAFVLSSVVFSYRVTNLRSLLFSILSAGVISLSSALLFVLVSMISGGFVEFFATAFLLLLGAIIIVIPMLSGNTGSKLFRSILINLSINGIVGYIFLFLGTISLYQREFCLKNNLLLGKYYADCDTLVENLGFNNISYIMLAGGFVFLALYSSIIRKWKASAE